MQKGWGIGLIAILLFSVELRWLPSGGMYTLGQEKSLGDLLKHLIMPATILSILQVAGWNRYIRASVLEVIRQDYVRTQTLQPAQAGFEEILAAKLPGPDGTSTRVISSSSPMNAACMGPAPP